MKVTFNWLFVLVFCFAFGDAFGQLPDSSLLPKYGSQPKSDSQKAADADFLAGVDSWTEGNRKLASEDFSSRGWKAISEGRADEAMRRFNQAWLLSPSNGRALWGMAVLQAVKGDAATSVKLFSEAEALIGDDVDFATDYAKTIGMYSALIGDQVGLRDAFARFAKVYAKAPDHVMNLQNWAITLFYIRDYASAWDRIKVAERKPRAKELDSNFIAELEKRMPRTK